MFCPACGHPNNDQAKFCVGCGNNLTQYQAGLANAPAVPLNPAPQEMAPPVEVPPPVEVAPPIVVVPSPAPVEPERLPPQMTAYSGQVPERQPASSMAPPIPPAAFEPPPVASPGPVPVAPEPPGYFHRPSPPIPSGPIAPPAVYQAPIASPSKSVGMIALLIWLLLGIAIGGAGAYLVIHEKTSAVATPAH
jgi:hypothetical protein